MATASDAIALEEVREAREATPSQAESLLAMSSRPSVASRSGNIRLAIAKDQIPPPSSTPTATITISSEETRVPAYSVFSKPQKWAIVLMAAASAFFSPISATIFLPALTDIANDLNVTVNAINITVTVYMIFQGLSPSLWGRCVCS